MRFNSYEFLFFFLPLTLLIYYLLRTLPRKGWARGFLLLASFWFYGWWDVKFLGLFLVSLGFNFVMSRLLWLNRRKGRPAGRYLVAGVIGNLLFLGCFKYADFFVGSLNALLHTDWPLLNIALPLAISFYTFQQIGFLADVSRGKVKNYTLLDYALFVSFFPQLISGPIARQEETLEQLRLRRDLKPAGQALAVGLYQFVIGLGKKVLIADTLAQWANLGFGAETLIMPEAWITSVAYTLQIYFDFSGYSDMAIGTARMFGIELPVNFDSPYKAVNIQEFWRRWHMTLSRLLRDVIYIPLGGSRKGLVRASVNTLITFLLCGLWHGAGWTFIIWGGLHGLALIVWRLFRKAGGRLPGAVGWVLTMLFVNAAWVFFRAPDTATALRILRAMADIHTLVLPVEWTVLPAMLSPAVAFGLPALGLILLMGCLTLLFPNSGRMAKSFVPRTEIAVFIAVIAVISILRLYHVNEFIYFNF